MYEIVRQRQLKEREAGTVIMENEDAE
jgi:hypothetical protein